MIGPMVRDPETLGRLRGTDIPLGDVEIYQANGRTIAEVLDGDRVFMAPPPSLDERRRA